MDAYNRYNKGPIFVLGLGLPNTGNFALEYAFKNILKYGHVYQKTLPENQSCEQLVQTLHKYNCCFRPKARRLYKHIWQNFPQVKFLLSVEKSAEIWADKFVSSTKVVKSRNIWNFYDSKIVIISECTPDIQDCWIEEENRFCKERLVNCYNKWISKITIEIPRTHLLILPVGSDWSALCTFLDWGSQVPKCKFPWHMTRKKQRISRLKRGFVKVVVYSIPIAVVVFVAVLMYYFGTGGIKIDENSGVTFLG